MFIFFRSCYKIMNNQDNLSNGCFLLVNSTASIVFIIDFFFLSIKRCSTFINRQLVKSWFILQRYRYLCLTYVLLTTRERRTSREWRRRIVKVTHLFPVSYNVYNHIDSTTLHIIIWLIEIVQLRFERLERGLGSYTKGDWTKVFVNSHCIRVLGKGHNKRKNKRE